MEEEIEDKIAELKEKIAELEEELEPTITPQKSFIQIFKEVNLTEKVLIVIGVILFTIGFLIL